MVRGLCANLGKKEQYIKNFNKDIVDLFLKILKIQKWEKFLKDGS